MNVYKVLQLYLLQLCTYTSSSTISTAVFKLTASDSGLAGHVIRKCLALTALDCAHECLAERPACKSINFITIEQADSVMNCELNNATKSAHPIKRYLAKNVNYYEIIEKRRTTGASVSSVQNAIGTFHANFTNLGASGRLGPQSVGSEYLSKDNENMVTVKEGIQFWTVPWTGTYEITAVGAAGGKDKYGLPGGRGANMKGEFDLKKGDVIKILVGQEGAKTDLIGGGGGGTFVATISNTPMIVAGGGGGAQGLNNQLLNCDASTETTEGNACSPGSSCSIWAGGANGTGALYGDAKSVSNYIRVSKQYFHSLLTLTLNEWARIRVQLSSQ
ncbi:ALK tyrosine kinase receptor-like [Dendronephthya gigantea]|uniref:ALK tyrosine kinase receptor-like n=1 Tax=Dendronephthya gigantea TaxID=151771 RepID=UPI00106A28D9|nr:ALK tyrosine kinase receptor-like [Dendronephthya gigantea]